MDPVLELALLFLSLIPLLLIGAFLYGRIVWRKNEHIKCPYCNETFEVRYKLKNGKKIHSDYDVCSKINLHLESEHPKEYERIRIARQITDLLVSAVMTLTVGASSTLEITEDAVWGILDPMYGLYRKSIGIGALGRRMAPEEARETIRSLYSRYPEIVNEYLEGVANNLDKYGFGVKIRLLLSSLKEERKIEDPLTTLKIRYAKGEITKEEYEEMKKTLESG